MTRIFSTLAVVDLLLLALAFWLGLQIDDPAAPTSAGDFATHFLAGVGAIVFAILVHSLVLTYFMGTGRWLEETCLAYRLSPDFPRRNRDLKWRVLPFLALTVLMLILTGGFGAAADPGATLQFSGALGLSAAGFHQAMALLTLTLHVLVHFGEFTALEANARLVEAVLAEVRRIRIERGLPIE